MKKMLKIKPFQETLSEKELAKLSKTSVKLGTNEQGIMRAAKQFGFKVKAKNKSTFKDIEKYLNDSIPVIVNWFSRGRSDYSDSCVPDGHYSVVCGIDDRYIYLQDPEIGRIRKIERGDFMTVWFDFTGKRVKPNELVIRQLIAIYK